jgi:nucleoside diphosphate kinase
MEQTYIMIKPDGVQRGLVGQIIQRFETKGFFLRGMKMMSVEKAHAEKHYADLSSKPFFGDLVDYMCSGPVVCMVWEGKEVVKTGRKIIGATNPLYVPRNHTPSRPVPSHALSRSRSAANLLFRSRRDKTLTDASPSTLKPTTAPPSPAPSAVTSASSSAAT